MPLVQLLSLSDSDPSVIALNEADTERNVEEAVLGLSPHLFTPGALCNILANVYKLTAAVCKKLSIVELYSLLSHHAPFGYKRDLQNPDLPCY